MSMNASRHRPQPQHKVTFVGHFTVPTARTGGPEAQARALSCCNTTALVEKKRCEGTWGIFTSAQQPSAHVDLHISIGAPREQGQQLEEYKFSRGSR